MNPIIQKVYQEYKECAGKACSNPGIYYLKVLYLGKSGWFCNSCKDSLSADGLVIEDRGQP